MVYKAEYIWIDGTEPTAKLRSKTKIVPDGAELPIWGFDGSSTNQATGDKSDCVLKPVFHCPDPIRGGDNVLVMCEVWGADDKPHPTNTRAALVEVAEKYANHEALFGIEQEYTFMKDGRPYGFPIGGYPGTAGRLLLRRRLRRDLRSRDRRGAPRQLPRGRPRPTAASTPR